MGKFVHYKWCFLLTLRERERDPTNTVRQFAYLLARSHVVYMFACVNVLAALMTAAMHGKWHGFRGFWWHCKSISFVQTQHVSKNILTWFVFANAIQYWLSIFLQRAEKWNSNLAKFQLNIHVEFEFVRMFQFCCAVEYDISISWIIVADDLCKITHAVHARGSQT